MEIVPNTHGKVVATLVHQSVALRIIYYHVHGMTESMEAIKCLNNHICVRSSYFPIVNKSPQHGCWISAQHVLMNHYVGS